MDDILLWLLGSGETGVGKVRISIPALCSSHEQNCLIEESNLHTSSKVFTYFNYSVLTTGPALEWPFRTEIGHPRVNITGTVNNPFSYVTGRSG